VPSRGSALHKFGACKPCAFVGHGVCRNGANCQFCHLCEPGEKKRRRKEWLETKRQARRHVEVGMMVSKKRGSAMFHSGFAGFPPDQAMGVHHQSQVLFEQHQQHIMLLNQAVTYIPSGAEHHGASAVGAR